MPWTAASPTGCRSPSTVVSPELYAELCFPCNRPQHDAPHELGFRVTWHAIGGTLGLKEHLVANGGDASETLAPKSVGGNQEPWELAAKIAGRVALIGGVDQHNVLTTGMSETIRHA